MTTILVSSRLQLVLVKNVGTGPTNPEGTTGCLAIKENTLVAILEGPALAEFATSLAGMNLG